MSQRTHSEVIARQAKIHDRSVVRGFQGPDRSFESPRGLYLVTAFCYLAFLAIMAATVASPGLIVPLGICTVFIGMFFAAPTVILRQTPESGGLAKSWGQLKARGIMTNTGHLAGHEAAVQMVMLPVLIVVWGLAVSLIVALV
ncbi:hypothetical protein [Altererythrobacter aquiaggeris]|uniref:hypothetical protein n=1 Tax=Aestuarierythrobacter aquiaggeris TaxID=1898396 RepID=UPI00301A0A81